MSEPGEIITHASTRLWQEVLCGASKPIDGPLVSTGSKEHVTCDECKKLLPDEAHHARNGNCWLVVQGKKCPVDYCGMKNCDVCHDHDEPRGECSECEPCKPCESERGSDA